MLSTTHYDAIPSCGVEGYRSEPASGRRSHSARWLVLP